MIETRRGHCEFGNYTVNITNINLVYLFVCIKMQFSVSGAILMTLTY